MDFCSSHRRPYMTPLFNLNTSSTSPLIEAIRTAKNNAAMDYIKKGEYILDVDCSQRTPLHYAVAFRNMEIINMLLKLPEIDKDVKDIKNNTPLHVAVQLSSNNIVMRLLEEGCNVNGQDYLQNTPLHYAIVRSSALVVDELIKRGADINCINGDGCTPLHLAVGGGGLDIVQILLYYGADVNIQCTDGLNPFMYAVQNSYHLIAKELLPYYDDFSTAHYKEGPTALSLAILCTSPIAIEIVKASADVNIVIEQDNTLLLRTLNYFSAELFREVWSRLDLDRFSRFSGSFLLSFIECSKFPTEEWLECLYDILDSSIISVLIDNVHMEMIFQSLFIHLKERQVLLPDRLSVIASLLSYGVEIRMIEMVILHDCFGFNKEFDLIINCGIIKKVDLKNDGIFTPIPFIFCDKILPNRFDILSLYLYMDLTPFRYFCIPHSDKQDLIKIIKDRHPQSRDIIEEINAKPDIPSLLQLARDTIRKSIKESGKAKEPHEFCKILKGLQMPRKLENVLFLKDPLYP